MPTYYFPTDFAGGTITVSDGDIFIIESTASSNIDLDTQDGNGTLILSEDAILTEKFGMDNDNDPVITHTPGANIQHAEAIYFRDGRIDTEIDRAGTELLQQPCLTGLAAFRRRDTWLGSNGQVLEIETPSW